MDRLPATARQLASVCARLRQTALVELRRPTSATARLARSWQGDLLPPGTLEETADAVAEAVTFGALAIAAGLPVPWFAAVPAELQAVLGPLEVPSAALDDHALYGAFLHAYRPALRQAHGVFGTPLPLVRAQVRLAADVLRRLTRSDAAFGDPRVGVLDPAVGDGAYLLAVIAEAQAAAAMPNVVTGEDPPHAAPGTTPAAPPAAHDGCAKPATLAVKDSLFAPAAVLRRTGADRPLVGAATLAGRLEAFEPLVGAAVLARARLGAALDTPAGRAPTADGPPPADPSATGETPITGSTIAAGEMAITGSTRAAGEMAVGGSARGGRAAPLGGRDALPQGGPACSSPPLRVPAAGGRPPAAGAHDRSHDRLATPLDRADNPPAGLGGTDACLAASGGPDACFAGLGGADSRSAAAGHADVPPPDCQAPGRTAERVPSATAPPSVAGPSPAVSAAPASIAAAPQRAWSPPSPEPSARVHVADALAAGCTLAAPILVCLGNPPYRRGRARPDGQLDAFTQGADGLGIHLKNVHNVYVAFWHWALRVVLEARAGPGVISFVTPASFLSGPGFAGMRAALRAAFDDVWVLDLGGDQRGARPTDNVFPIRSPVAIAMGVRYGAVQRGRPATVWYTCLRGARQAKLDTLASVQRLDDLPWSAVTGEGRGASQVRGGAPFIAHPRGSYHAWPKLTDLFPVQLSGCQVKRTWPIAPDPAVLLARWASLLARTDPAARLAAFRPTRDRDLRSRPPDLLDPSRHLEPLADLPPGTASVRPVPYAYRSFDRQWLLPDSRLGDFLRPRLWRLAGPRQLFLTSLLSTSLGPGPAAVVTALVPDLDHFRGSFGARAVMPLWLDAQASQPNVDPHLADALAQRLGTAVSPSDLLAACYALLATPSYVERFHVELAEPGPRVPLPRQVAHWQTAVALGRRLIGLHTFGARAASPEWTLDGPTRCLQAPSATPEGFSYRAADHTLEVGDGRFGPVSPGVWAFSVSGLGVVRSWLRYRLAAPKRRTSPLDDIRPAWTSTTSAELLEVLWVLEATLALVPALDALLDEVVAVGG